MSYPPHINLEANHEKQTFALAAIQAGTSPMLIGPSGCGKTTMVRKMAVAMNVPFYYTGAVDSAFQLRGFMDAQGRFVETSFVKAYKNGGIFLFDEIDASDPQALVAVHAGLDNGVLDTPVGMITKHPDFHFIGAANTWGHGATLEYMGRNHLDGATLDRFIPVITMDYDESFELKLLVSKFPTMSLWGGIVHAARHATRQLAIRKVISTRAHLKGAALLNEGIALNDVIDSILLWGLDPDSKIKLTKKIETAVKSYTKYSPKTNPTSQTTSTRPDTQNGETTASTGTLTFGGTDRKVTLPYTVDSPSGSKAKALYHLFAPRFGHKDAQNGVLVDIYFSKVRSTGEYKAFFAYAAPSIFLNSEAQPIQSPFDATLRMTQNLKNWYGFDGAQGISNENALDNALQSGEATNKWVIPPASVMRNYFALIKGNQIQEQSFTPKTEAYKGSVWTLTGLQQTANYKYHEAANLSSLEILPTVPGSLSLGCQPCRFVPVPAPAG